MRTEKCEVFITGSSAQMLSREIATQMRGRALSWEMFPFSFREFLDFKALESDEPLTTKNRYIVQKAFEEYWKTGGFPEVAGIERQLRIKIHQEYFNAMLFRDLVELKMNFGTIVTRNENDQIQVKFGEIEVVPA